MEEGKEEEEEEEEEEEDGVVPGNRPPKRHPERERHRVNPSPPTLTLACFLTRSPPESAC